MLLVQAGFEVRCTLAPGAEHWLPPEPIRLLTGFPPIPFSQTPNWPGGGRADLGVAVLANAAPWLGGPTAQAPAPRPEPTGRPLPLSGTRRGEAAEPDCSGSRGPVNPAPFPSTSPPTSASLPRESREPVGWPGTARVCLPPSAFPGGPPDFVGLPWLLVATGADDLALPALPGPPPIIGVVPLPGLPGAWSRTFEEVFTRIVRFLRGRPAPGLAPRRVAVQHLVPAALAATGDRPPRWVDDLRRFLALAGVDLHGPGPESADIQILTYGGPFPKAPARAKPAAATPGQGGRPRRAAAPPLSFAAVHAPLPVGSRLTVPFFTPATPAAELEALTRLEGRPGRVLPVMRAPDGTLTVFGDGPARVFPDLTARPALERLVEHLLDLPLTSRSGSPTI